MKELNNFWGNNYLENRTGRNVGIDSTSGYTYSDQIQAKTNSSLIPAVGNANGTIYLFENAFNQLYVYSWLPTALQTIQKQIPKFPTNQLLNMDYFPINGQFDYIYEQTFFCTIRRNLRPKYAEKVASLLSIEKEGPPNGGTESEHKNHFSLFFEIQIIEPCYNSNSTSVGNEVFVKLKKK